MKKISTATVFILLIATDVFARGVHCFSRITTVCTWEDKIMYAILFGVLVPICILAILLLSVAITGYPKRLAKWIDNIH